jgi:hypothetical protein
MCSISLLKSHHYLDNVTYSATLSSIMADYKQKKKPVPSRLLAGFGAVPPSQKLEDWRKVQEEMEEAMADEVATEDRSPNTDN